MQEFFQKQPPLLQVVVENAGLPIAHTGNLEGARQAEVNLWDFICKQPGMGPNFKGYLNE